jgi:hypothetical protein
LIHSVAPWQAHGRIGECRHAFATAGEAQLLAGGRFQAHSSNRDAGYLRNTGAYEIPMRADAWSLANHRDIKMRNVPTPRAHPIDRKGKEPIG